ncbi:hypothetical protein FGO68_gene15126 [Halteria grandinella]|uniref:Right handed beta helix domain-containing protein n=1 Tax=Halteria grandinella TaxID=5974 RepID=A0A8J8TA86_HALGN|nr:hypothetical protein FGO68_gene15126 [Halteria grandinella]
MLIKFIESDSDYTLECLNSVNGNCCQFDSNLVEFNCLDSSGNQLRPIFNKQVILILLNKIIRWNHCYVKPMQGALFHVQLNDYGSTISSYTFSTNITIQVILPTLNPIQNCQLTHFFYEMNSLVMLPIQIDKYQQPKYTITLEGSTFNHFSSCGSILSNYNSTQFYLSPPNFFFEYDHFSYRGFLPHYQDAINQQLMRRYMPHKAGSTQLGDLQISSLSRYNANKNFTRQMVLKQNTFSNLNQLKKRHNDKAADRFSVQFGLASVKNETIRDLGFVVSIEGNTFIDVQQEFAALNIDYYTNSLSEDWCISVQNYFQYADKSILNDGSELMAQQSHLLSIREVGNALIVIANNDFRNISLAGALINLEIRTDSKTSPIAIAGNKFSIIHGQINNNVVSIIRQRYLFPNDCCQDMTPLGLKLKSWDKINLGITIAGGSVIFMNNKFSEITGCREVDTGVLFAAVSANNIKNPETYQRNRPVPELYEDAYFMEYILGNEYKYLQSIPVNIPAVGGQIIFNHTNVNISGNSYFNLTMGVSRVQDSKTVRGSLHTMIKIVRTTIENETYVNIGAYTSEYSSFLLNKIMHVTTSYNTYKTLFKDQSTLYEGINKQFFEDYISSTLIQIQQSTSVVLGGNILFQNIWLIDRLNALSIGQNQGIILNVAQLEGSLNIGSSDYQKPIVIKDIMGFLNNDTLTNEAYLLDPSNSIDLPALAQYGTGSPLFNFHSSDNKINQVIFQNVHMQNMIFSSNVSNPGGDKTRVPAIFSTDTQQDYFENVASSILVANVTLQDVQFDGSTNFFKLLSKNTTVKNYTMNNIGNIDIAQAYPRLRDLVLRDKIYQKENIGMIKVVLFSKSYYNNANNNYASQASLSIIKLTNFNQTGAGLPLIFIEMLYNDAPEEQAYFNVSDLVVSGQEFEEANAASWTNPVKSSIFQVSNSESINLYVNFKNLKASNLYSQCKYHQFYIYIDGIFSTGNYIQRVSFTNCVFIELQGRYASLLYAPIGTVNSLSFNSIRFTGFNSESIKLDYSNFLNSTSGQYSRVSMLKLVSVKTVEIINSYASGNHYAVKGAFIDASQGSGIYINGSQFEEFSAGQGGVITLAVQSILIIRDCQFLRNSAMREGVVQINVESTLEIYNSIFEANQALQNGVMKVAGDSDLTIDSCVFKENRAEQKNSIGSFFLIKSKVVFKDTLFQQNNAYISVKPITTQVGKLLEFISISAPIRISDCQFIDNQAYFSTPNLYFFDTQDATITNSDFANKLTSVPQSASINGNFIQIQSTAIVGISKCTFTSGQATSGGAVYISGEAKVTIKSSQFIGNTALKQGGAIFGDSLLHLAIEESSQFIENQGTLYGGDGIFVQNAISASINIYDTQFTTKGKESNFLRMEDVLKLEIKNVKAVNTNPSPSPIYKVGGFFLRNIYELKLAQSEFTNLYGAYAQGGGAIVIEYTDDYQISPAVISDCVIQGTSSTTKGAGLALINPKQMQIERVILKNNRAKQQGGGMFFSCNIQLSELYPCELTLLNTSFIDNYADLEGGAIKWNYFEPILQNVTFNNNTSGVYGDNIGSVARKLVRVKKEQVGSKSLSSGSLSLLEADNSDSVVQSGGTISLYFGLVDKYGSFVRTDNASSLIIQQGTRDIISFIGRQRIIVKNSLPLLRQIPRLMLSMGSSPSKI